MAHILVTGASGILGQALLPQLIEAGHRVRGTSRRPAGPEYGTIEWAQVDLETGQGLAEAVTGVEAIIHAASSLQQTRLIDVEGTQRLLEQAHTAGVSHFIYVSIVGVDKIPLGYYQHKLAAEQVVTQGGVPWSILRATQFHTLIDFFLSKLTPLPVALLPTDFQFQAIDPGSVARRLVEVVEAGPGGRLPDIGGPEVLRLGEMARTWLDARGQRRLLVRLPLPGKIAAGYRQGLNTAPEGRYGHVTWAEWLQRQYSQNKVTSIFAESPQT